MKLTSAEQNGNPDSCELEAEAASMASNVDGTDLDGVLQRGRDGRAHQREAIRRDGTEQAAAAKAFHARKAVKARDLPSVLRRRTAVPSRRQRAEIGTDS